MSTDIPLKDYIAIGNLTFEWAQSYDLKDWDRLRAILAPQVTLDYSGVASLGFIHENLSPDQYVAMLSDQKLLGDKRLKTQHLIGGTKWELLDDGSVLVANQVRAAHQRYANDELTVVANKGHSHGVASHWYRKFEGSWKLERMAATSEWAEFDLGGTLSGKDSLNH